MCNVSWLRFSHLRFVWRDVDTICHVITLGDHFHFFGTVVHNISPGLCQKNLDSFQETIAEVVVVGCIEGIRRHGDDVVHAAKSRPDWVRTRTDLKEAKNNRAMAAHLWRSSCLKVFKWSSESSSSMNRNISTWLSCCGWLTTSR